MKKIGLIIATVGALLIAAGPTFAVSPGETGIDLPKGTHVKVDVCHWANGHPHIVPVSVNAVTTSQDAKHGDLTLTASLSLGSFVAHDTPGHEEDFVARIYTKHGNDEVNTYVSTDECGGDEPPGQPELVTLSACLNGTVSTFGPGLEATVDAELEAFLNANEDAVVGTVCPVEETTTTTSNTVVTTPDVPEVPVVENPPAPVAPVVDAPVAPGVRTAPKPVALPHTL